LALLSQVRPVSQVGIVALIESDQPRRRIEALNCGADCAVPLNVHPDELVAVVRRLAQRVASAAPRKEVVDLGDFHLVRTTGRCVVAGRDVRLTSQEFRLLWHMAASGKATYSHDELQRALWPDGEAHSRAFLRPVVLQVRKKVEPDWHNPVYVLTDHTLGYRFNAVAQPIAAAAQPASPSTREWLRGFFRNP
jgi:two-component system KDP operon response regulator KdpE